MKKIYSFLAAALTVVVAASCSKNDVQFVNADSNLVEVSVNATLADDVKAVADLAGKVTWTAGDKIAVYIGGNPYTLTLSAGEGTSTGTFSGQAAAGDITSAVYPACSLDPEYEQGAQEIPAGGTCDPNALLMRAEAPVSGTLNFKLGVGALQFTVEAGTDGVFFYALNEDNVPLKVAVDLGSNSSAGTFNALVPAGTYHSLVALLAANDGSFAKEGSNVLSVADGHLVKLGNVKGDACTVITDADELNSYLSADPSTQLNAYVAGPIDMADKSLATCAAFGKKFNGLSMPIMNLATDVCMFETVAAGAEVMNVVIDESCALNLTSTADKFGFIASVNNGKLSNIINKAPVTVSVASKTYKGIICGQNANGAAIEDCVNFGDLSYSGANHTDGTNYYGCIAGQSTGADALVKGCRNNGNVVFDFNDVLGQSIYVAGIVGANNSNAKILNCGNTGRITVKCPGCKTNGQVAGIVCYSGGEVAYCANLGNISFISESEEGKADGQVKGTGVAGIACYEGWANGTITKCNNYGNITLRAGYSIGYQTVGSATKWATNVGGVVAHAWNCSLDECLNYGTITSDIKAIDKSPDGGFQTTARHAIAGIVASSCGNITNCVNEGAVKANWITTAHNAALAKNFVMMAGGITGGCYNGNKLDVSEIKGCENKGEVYITCDSSGSNNNVGGIVGWSSKEAACAAVIENCKNSGAVTHDGYGKVRFGGIAGAGSTLKNCENSGKVYLKGSTNNSCVGGILGWFNFNGVIDCKNTGDVQSDVNITNALAAGGANYSSQCGIGGIVGGHGNTDVTFTGNAVNCKVTAPAGCKFAAMIFGMTDRDKTAAVGKKLAVGTAESPIKVKGSFGSTTLTSSNYTDYIKYTGYLNLNPDVTYSTVFGE